MKMLFLHVHVGLTYSSFGISKIVHGHVYFFVVNTILLEHLVSLNFVS